MTVYVVHGNTWYEGYGHMEHLFGVYTNEDAAKAAKDHVAKQLYEEEIGNPYTSVKTMADIEVDILEVDADELVNIELGGYWE